MMSSSWHSDSPAIKAMKVPSVRSRTETCESTEALPARTALKTKALLDRSRREAHLIPWPFCCTAVITTSSSSRSSLLASSKAKPSKRTASSTNSRSLLKAGGTGAPFSTAACTTSRSSRSSSEADSSAPPNLLTAVITISLSARASSGNAAKAPPRWLRTSSKKSRSERISSPSLERSIGWRATAPTRNARSVASGPSKAATRAPGLFLPSSSTQPPSLRSSSDA
mmetsp:Transcript_36313/g.85120  ORF Transcript_36313/g.85120 Transcript_36313/m.85120 type:complete len:226 (+) Transcript_36313:163-840(+)